MRGVLSGFAVVALLAGMTVPSFASQATLTTAMSAVANCKTVAACQIAWANFLRELPTAGLSSAQIAKLQVAAIGKVTSNLGASYAQFASLPEVQRVVLSPAFATASGGGGAPCNFVSASASGFCA